MGITNGLDKLRGFVDENLPHILTGVGVIGLVATAYEAYKAGKKVEKMEEKKPKEVAKALLPAVATGVVSAAATISSDVVHTKRYASLLTSYLIAKAEGSKLKKAADEVLGKDKVKEIESKIRNEEDTAQEEERAKRIAGMPSKTRYKVVDLITGFEFVSTIEQLLKTEQKVARITSMEGRCTLEEFYNMASLDDGTFDAPGIADHIYWDSDTNTDQMDLVIDRAVEEDMVPYLTIGYNFAVRDTTTRWIP